MLTSAGRSSRMSESTAFGVGSMMSMSRLCVRISKCSRLSLYLWGERMTAITFFSVGSGTGPTTWAPARVTVSTIFRAELSSPAWSYDFSRMRIFCPAMCSSFRAHCCAARGLATGHLVLSLRRRDDVSGAARSAPLFCCGWRRIDLSRVTHVERTESAARLRVPGRALASAAPERRVFCCPRPNRIGCAQPDSDPAPRHLRCRVPRNVELTYLAMPPDGLQPGRVAHPRFCALQSRGTRARARYAYLPRD